MESWEGHNYYTGDNIEWTQLMNLSTAEWSIGWIPSNVIAIPGTLNGSSNFPPNTVVIENASMTDIGPYHAEAIIFGTCSGVALLWAAFWLYWSIKHRTLRKPRVGSRQRPSLTDGKPDEREGDFHAADFEARMDKYYPRFASHAELYERDGAREGGLPVEEVTAVSELLVRMFRNDTRIKALQSTTTEREEMERLRAESDAMLGEVHRRVNGGGGEGLSEQEGMELHAARVVLARHQPPRYVRRVEEGSEWRQREEV